MHSGGGLGDWVSLEVFGVGQVQSGWVETLELDEVTGRVGDGVGLAYGTTYDTGTGTREGVFIWTRAGGSGWGDFCKVTGSGVKNRNKGKESIRVGSYGRGPSRSVPGSRSRGEREGKREVVV